jgi:D-glycerate 3-kinase
MDRETTAILEYLVRGEACTDLQRQQLARQVIADVAKAAAFAITPQTVDAEIATRVQLLPELYPQIQHLWQSTSGISGDCLELLWTLWLPLALKLVRDRQQLSHPLIQGILGSQGAGKTTLTQMLCLILFHLGYPSLSLSLDDFYKTYTERQQLRQHDPRLKWRGPPGTHDLELALETLDRLRDPGLYPNNQLDTQEANSHTPAISIPRFDKTAHAGEGDRCEPDWVCGVEIVLFEGWFVGVQPIDPSQFDQAPAPIVTDSDRAFARDMNAKLRDYQPLWQRLDSLIVMVLEDYQLSKAWRLKAEQKAIAAGKPGMTPEQIDQFVDYFWQALHPALFIQPLTQNPQVDLVIEVNAKHLPSRVYRPGARS